MFSPAGGEMAGGPPQALIDILSSDEIIMVPLPLLHVRLAEKRVVVSLSKHKSV